MKNHIESLLAPFDDTAPLAQARTIPAAWYHDADLAERERRIIFGNTWLAVGRSDQVAEPGMYFTTEIAGEPLVIVCAEDRQLHGFYNVCRHRGAQVACQAEGTASRFRCHYHGWTYDLTGRLRGTPEFDGVADFAREDNGLPSVAVAQSGPLVWAHLGQSPGPLADWLAPLSRRGLDVMMQPLGFVARKEYHLRCNWKVFIDNYLDGGYHVNTIHPGLAGVLDYTKYRTEIDGHASVQISPLDRAGDDPVATVRKGDNAYYAWVFPNLMLNLYEGVMDTNIVLPDGPGACRVVFDFYFADRDGEAAQAFIQRSMAVADQIQQEDLGICEEVQRGLHSGSYDTGRFSVRREAGGYHFHQLLARTLRTGLAPEVTR